LPKAWISSADLLCMSVPALIGVILFIVVAKRAG
jgi:hypothetical protein